MRKDDLLIDKTLKAFERVAFRSGNLSSPFAWWPLNFILYMPLYMPQFTHDFRTDFWSLRKSKSIGEIAQAFQYPTALWLGLVPFLSKSREIDLEKRERVKIILEFLKMLEVSMTGNIFCEGGQNIVWDKKGVKNITQKTNWIDVKKRPDFTKLFARLHSGLISLDEAIFWNANCATREIHGPYKVKWKNTPCQLIIREYYNLNEPQLLPRNLSSSFKSVSTLAIYNSRVRFDFPILNDYTHDLPLLENTKALFGVAIRDNKIELLNNKRIIKKACESIEKDSLKIGSWVESLSEKERIIKTVDRYYYREKPIRDLLRKDWQPPKSLIQNIRKRFPSFQPIQRAGKMTKKQFYQMFDPRIDL